MVAAAVWLRTLTVTPAFGKWRALAHNFGWDTPVTLDLDIAAGPHSGAAGSLKVYSLGQSTCYRQPADLSGELVEGDLVLKASSAHCTGLEIRLKIRKGEMEGTYRGPNGAPQQVTFKPR